MATLWQVFTCSGKCSICTTLFMSTQYSYILETIAVQFGVLKTRSHISNPHHDWPQEELYSLILETNKECIKLCKPGASINEIHNHSVCLLASFWFSFQFSASWFPFSFLQVCISDFISEDPHLNISRTQVKMLIKGFQELGVLEKGKSIQYNYLNPTAIGQSRCPPVL